MFTLKLTEQEMTGLSGLLDAGVKAIGIRSCKDAVAIIDKMQEALENGDLEKPGEAKKNGKHLPAFLEDLENGNAEEKKSDCFLDDADVDETKKK